MGLFKHKDSKVCYAKSNTPQCSLVEDLRKIQALLSGVSAEYDRIKSRKFYSPRILESDENQKETIWNMGILQLLDRGSKAYHMYTLSRTICPSLSDIMDAILSLNPEDQLKFVSAYDAIAPTVKEMRERDETLIRMKANIDELLGQEKSVKQKLGII